MFKIDSGVVSEKDMCHLATAKSLSQRNSFTKEAGEVIKPLEIECQTKTNITLTQTVLFNLSF